MILQRDLWDARLWVAKAYLGLSLWAELRGLRLRAYQFARDANEVFREVAR